MGILLLLGDTHREYSQLIRVGRNTRDGFRLTFEKMRRFKKCNHLSFLSLGVITFVSVKKYEGSKEAHFRIGDSLRSSSSNDVSKISFQVEAVLSIKQKSVETRERGRCLRTR